MSNLAAAIAAKNSVNKGPTCTVATVLGKLTKAQAADLRACLADRGITAPAIREGLKAETGHQVSDSALSRHRRGACGCAR